MWDKLSEDEKESYLKKSHTLKLAYKYKKMIYDKKIKKILPKKPATAYGYFLKEKNNEKAPVAKLLKMAAKEWTSEDVHSFMVS